MHLRHGSHKSRNVKRTRDSAANPCGISEVKDQRLRSSAMTLDSDWQRPFDPRTKTPTVTSIVDI